MSDSRVPTAWTALYEVVRTDPDLVAMAPRVPVWFGSIISGDSADAVYIGYDGDPEGEMAAVIGDEDWAGLGARTREENFSIICSVVVINGASDIPAGVARCYAIFAGVARAVRANPSLGQPTPFAASIKSPQLSVVPTEQGAELRLVFHVAIKTRI